MSILRTLLVVAGLSGLTGNALATEAELQRAFIGFHGELPANIASELEQAGAVHGLVFPSVETVYVHAPQTLLDRYAADPRVRGIRSERRLRFGLYESVGLINARDLDIVAPNSRHRPANGAGVTIGVVDSGIHAEHPDFEDRVKAGYNFALSFLADHANGVLGADEWDQIAISTGNVAMTDDYYHGTHVAGIAAGGGQAASGMDARGVAPRAELISFKIGTTASGQIEHGWEANVVAAFDFILRNPVRFEGMRVLNNSWGLFDDEFGPVDFDPISELTRKIIQANFVTVFAAGNTGPGPDTVWPPADRVPEAIVVAAACKPLARDSYDCPEGGVNDFSARGDAIDIAAPGNHILSAVPPHMRALRNSNDVLQSEEGYYGSNPADIANNAAHYYVESGTSMAAPHVAGVAAMMLQVNRKLTPAQIESILIETARDLVDDDELKPGWDAATGHGMIDARAALIRASELAKTGDVVAASERAAAMDSSDAQAGAPGWLVLILVTAGAIRQRRR